jgi:CubicO group peptidase (beta-lactamase class C family)
MSVRGFSDPRFSLVTEEFERNFAERGELGASVCVTLDGEIVVDLWGGVVSADSGRPWERDTMTVVASATKGATALCAMLLVDRGLLGLDAPVSSYWPEYGCRGKEATTVRMLLSHEAGLPVFRQRIPDGAWRDWRVMVDALVAEEAAWEPGTQVAYHASTFGWLVGEVVRRVSGRSVGRFFRDEIGDPLGIDFWIGLPEYLEPRVAPFFMPPSFWDDLPALADDSDDPALLWANLGGYFTPDTWNSRDAHAAELPAGGGISHARGLAGLYWPLACGGLAGATTFLGADTVALLGQTYAGLSRDPVYGMPMRFGLGFRSLTDYRVPPGAFGCPGYGGALGFADPAARLSFGYVPNRGTDEEATTSALVNAVYRSLGYRRSRHGFWYRR